jgi:competence protein ComEC
MIPNHKGEIPVVILLIPFLLGIGLGLNLPAGAGIFWLSIIFFTLSFVFIALNLNYSRFGLYKHRWLGGIFIVLILFLFGWINASRFSELNKSDHFSKIPSQYLVVKITNEPTLKNGILRFTAAVEESISKAKKTNTSGTLLIAIKDSSAKNLYYRDELLIPAKYNTIDPPFNPAEFDYKKYLANQNIYYQAFLYPKQYKLLNSNTGNSLIARSLRLRQHLVEKLKRNMADTGAFAVASTLILGYKADLSDDIKQAYSKTGTMYVLSVSGGQVAIIYILLTFVLKFLTRFKHGKLVKAFIIIGIIWYYAMLTGFSLSVCRVALMVSLVTVGKTFSRHINTLNILAVSAFLLLIYDPFYITEVGFQISYIAVSGLILFQPVVYQWLKFKNKIADKLWAVCSVSIAAQVIVFPLSALYFHQFPVYFLFSNLFIIIPSAVVMYSGILYLLLPQIPFISKAIAFILEKTIQLMNKGLSVIENAPYASINKLWLTTPEYLLLSIIIISFFYFLYDKNPRLLKLSLFCSLLFCLSFSLKKISLSQTNSIAWLNLKKHQGIIFKKGTDAIVLTDLKNTDKIYQYSIQPYLDSCQAGNVMVYNLSQDINTTWLIKKRNLVKFLNKKVVIFDKQMGDNVLPQKFSTDFIYLTGNPNAGLNNIDNSFNYRELVVDGSNSDQLVNKIRQQTINRNVIYKLLKRNNSQISVSNE